MILLALGIIIGFLCGLVAQPVVEAVQEWRVRNRKFTCGVCKERRKSKHGYSPVSLDLEYGEELILPLNLFICKNCTGGNA